ncbi:MAG: ABC transporter substrate-binding protein [Chloroflexota bacterium]
MFNSAPFEAPRWLFIVAGAIFFLSGCQFGTKPVIKIGLIAPFEGELSHIGYQRLYGVKLALQEVNHQGGIAGYKIELVALNDFGDKQESLSQIQELIIDDDIKAVVGQWDSDLFSQAVGVYDTAELTVIDPTQFADTSSLSDTFDVSYQQLSHTPPTIDAKQAYLATSHLIHMLEQTISTYGQPIRAHIWHASNVAK